jgi:hypothetical protein
MAVGYLQLWKPHQMALCNYQYHLQFELYSRRVGNLKIDAYLELTQPLHVSCKPPARNDQSAVVLAMKAPNHNLARDADFDIKNQCQTSTPRF